MTPSRVSPAARSSVWGTAAFMFGMALVDLPLPIVLGALFGTPAVILLVLLVTHGRVRQLWIVVRQSILWFALHSFLLLLPAAISSHPLYSSLHETVDIGLVFFTFMELVSSLSPEAQDIQLHLHVQEFESELGRFGENVVKAVLSRISPSPPEPERFPLLNLKTLQKTRIAHLLVPNLSIDEPRGIQPRTFLQEPQDRMQLLREKARDHLKCCICFGFLCQPYILGCGHVFDISCLISWLTHPSLLKDDPCQIRIVDLLKGCPICRAPLETSPISLFFLNGLQEMFADAEDAADSPGLQPRLRFIPLDTVYPDMARRRALAGGQEELHFILRDGEFLVADEPLEQEHPEAPPQHLLLPAQAAAPQFDEEE
ncbi:hypothetical protein FB45DRAFT_919083 [Roridomyces roridus]|uniref:RING-type domain-containing protein n=1 Tax=Roridomyces roridus TaxID=1738132 RepID=A0AAD7BRJ5_9AGAR|nr:hypothetical protein FB45DRAFT_919083 [Roridomyces roridus]